MNDNEFENKLKIIIKKIEDFNDAENFQKNEYENILNDLSYLYCNLTKIKTFCYSIRMEKEKSELRKKLIDLKKNNFKILTINKLDKLIKSQIKSANYNSCLYTIEQLENIINSIDITDELKTLIKNCKRNTHICKFKIDLNEANNLIQEKKFEEAINRFEFLTLSYSDEKEREYFQRQKEISIANYINYILNENMPLIKTEKVNDIINNLEIVIDKYKNYSKMNRLVNQLRILYGKCLETIIEKKQKNYLKCDEELIKYNSLADITNLGYKLINFKEKYEINEICSSKKDENFDEKNKKYESNLISMETIENYLGQIKEKTELNKELEDDIYTQVRNYNEEIKSRNQNYIKIKDWLEINKEKIGDKNFRGNVFAFLNSINKKVIKYDIRPIQLISLLFLSYSDTGIFLQINTGEGKSLIIQIFAAYLALTGKKVDIISSSSVLADRDAGDQNKIEFFENLGISVGTASKDEYYKDIVYGDTQNFEAGILREEFKKKKVRHNRPYDSIIVDEVDSISLDNIITMTQLTDNFPGRSCFFFFYYQIIILFCTILDELGKSNEEAFLKDPDKYKNIIRNYIKNNIANNLLNEDKKTLRDDLPIIYPKCMKSYIENFLDTWIDNIIKSSTMFENKDFIISEGNIVPVDFSNTGVLQNNMVWDGGLQQFLQIIHNGNSTFENESTNFLSNVSFFKRYKGHIYGVTGTFGGINFQKILREVYKVKLFIIPPNKVSLLKNEGGIICKNKKDYKEKIMENIKKEIQKKRSILLICNSIAEGMEFFDELEKIYKKDVMKYFKEDDSATIEKELDIGKIIVATNLAGRGTDIKISNKLEKKGGLHVIVTFLPLNQRIEDQNYGRAGRKGQPGSHILIMLYNNEYGELNDNELNFRTIKEIRENKELKNTENLLANEMKFIEKKEVLFSHFCKYLNNNYDRANCYEKSNIEEEWGIILKNNNIDKIKSDYKKLTDKDGIRPIKNTLIEIAEMIHSSNINENIFQQEPLYSWAARLKYACLLAIEDEKGNVDKKEKALREFNIVEENLDLFLEDLSSQSSLNTFSFGFFIKNKKLIEEKDFKTKINIQNDNRKDFIESIKSLIGQNKEVIEKFISQYKGDKKALIKVEKKYSIEKILEISEKLKAKKDLILDDILLYMNEFGFDNFEILEIERASSFFSNIFVFALGVLEFCAGAALLYLAKGPKLYEIAKFLIQEGIKDVVESVKATLKGEEIDLKQWGLKKAVSIIKLAFKLVSCPGSSNFADSYAKKFLGIIKDQCVNLTKEYATGWASQKIVSQICNFLQDKMGIREENINILDLLSKDVDIFLQFDIIENTEKFQNIILEKVSEIKNNIHDLYNSVKSIIDFIKRLINENSDAKTKFGELFEFATHFDFKSFYDKTIALFDSIKDVKLSELKKELNFDLFYIIMKLNITKRNDIEEMYKELFEYGLIDKDGRINSEYIIREEDKKQKFMPKIDSKYLKFYNTKSGQSVPKEVKDFANRLAFSFSENSLKNKRHQVSKTIFENLKKFIEEFIKAILDMLVDKTSAKLDKLVQNKKESLCIVQNKNSNSNFIENLPSELVIDVASNLLSQLISSLLEKLFKRLKEYLNKLLDLVLSLFDKLFDKIGTMIMILKDKIEIFEEEIVPKIEEVLKVFENIKNIVSNILKMIINKKIDLYSIVEITNNFDYLLGNKLSSFYKEIEKAAKSTFYNIENNIKNRYNKIKTSAIDFYEKKKKTIDDKFNYALEKYSVQKEKIKSIDSNIYQLYLNKKYELKQKYNDSKKSIIEKTNLKINDINNIDLSFLKIVDDIKKKLIEKLNNIKNKVKNKIMELSSKIKFIIDDITDVINQLIQINCDKYYENFNENKFTIIKEILSFVLDVMSGLINLKVNKNKIIDEKHLKNSLVRYVEEKLSGSINSVNKIITEIIKKNSTIIIKIIEKLDKVKDFTKDKFELIKKNYQYVLNMAQEYINFMNTKFSDYIFNLINEIDSIKNYFEYLIEYFGNIKLYELLFKKQLDHINEFKNKMIEKINKVKNKNLEDICEKCEKEIKGVYEKYIEKNALGIIKKGKDLMTNTIQRGEDAIFGGLNSIIMTEDDRNKNYNSEFDKFKNGTINSIDNKICNNSKNIEDKIMSYIGNLDQYARDYLREKFPSIIDKNLFALLKEKKEKNFSNSIFKKDKKLEICLDKFIKPELINKKAQVVDSINFDGIHTVINEIHKLSSLLEPLNKEDIKKKIKDKIKGKIKNAYESKIEPELKIFVEKVCKEIITRISNKLKKK